MKVANVASSANRSGAPGHLMATVVSDVVQQGQSHTGIITAQLEKLPPVKVRLPPQFQLGSGISSHHQLIIVSVVSSKTVGM